MKTIQTKIAEQTLNLLKTNDWESITIDKICRKLKVSNKKISSNIKSKSFFKTISTKTTLAY